MTTASRGPLWVSLGLVALAIAVFWPSVAALAELWSHPERRTYQHGYLIAAIAFWLLYRERGRLAAAVSAPAWPMLAVAALGGFAWAVAWNASLQVLHFLIWPAVLWSALTGAFGWRAGRVLLLPVGFVYFAMPIWDALTPLLQIATVKANEVLALLAGMPVIIEDTLVHIPEGSFEIAGGCSGLNYLIVGLAIATLLGEVNRDTPRRRVTLIAIGAAMAIASNWLRVFIIIYAGHASDMTHYLVRVDHYNFGWVLYAFVLAGFFLIARRLPVADRPAGMEAQPARFHASPAVLIAAVAAVGLGPAVSHASTFVAVRTARPHGVGVSVLDIDVADRWRAMPASGDWVPVFPGADAESLVEFSSGTETVAAYTATYLRQAQGRELIGHDSRVEGSGRGRLAIRGSRRVRSEPAIDVIEGEWRDAGGGSSLLWWTYQVGALRFTNGLAAQLYYGLAALRKPPISSVVVLRVACRRDCDQARQSLESYSADLLPQLLAASVHGGG